MKTKLTLIKLLTIALFAARNKMNSLFEMGSCNRSLNIIWSFLLTYSFRALEIFYQVYK